MHGVFTVHPWLADPARIGDLVDLTVEHLYDRDPAAAGPTAWCIDDVGGDWTDDGAVHQLAWAETTLFPLPADRRLPLAPVVRVLWTTLGRAGTLHRFTGLHATLPLHRLAPSGAALDDSVQWLALADPSGTASFTATVASAPGAGVGARRAELRTAFFGRVHDLVEPVPESLRAGPSRPSGSAGGPHVPGLTSTVTFGCLAREWSVDVAVLVVEALADALRAMGVSGVVMIGAHVAD